MHLIFKFKRVTFISRKQGKQNKNLTKIETKSTYMY